MPLIYFYHLPANVARRAFRDVIEKTIQNNSENPETAPKPTIGLEIPDRPTAELKHSGHGYIDIPDDKTAEIFLAKLKVEPIMFESEKIIFSREKSSELEATSSLQSQVRVARPAPAVSPPVSRPQRANARAPATNESTSKQRSPGVKMNLNRTKFPQQEKREVRPPNVKYLRKLQHRLSVLGHHIRVERLEFGVLRDKNFSVEYSRSLIEETGWMIFEDDEKSIRVTMRGSHQDSTMPSVAISIQTVNYVGLGTEGNSPYMFLVLSQNPHFELGDIARPSKGNARLDAKRSRTRHPCLDERHERVAPFASRWIRLVLHQDNSVLPDIEVCQMAGLPRPEIDPPLTFNKLDMYSLRNITAVLKWVQSGSLRWDVAFQCEALFRNGTLVPQELLALRPTIEAIAKEDPQRAADALKTFRAEIEGAGARRTFNDFENKNVVDAFDKHINNSKKSTPAERLRSGISKSNFMCYHVKITPTAVHLAGPLAEQSNRVIRRYPDLESYFIRVSFTDEADGRTRFEYEVDTHGFTRERLGGFLKNRIRIGDRLYELLGYSQSGFRDHSCFFSAPFTFNGQEITAQSIRDSLGDFEKVINCPARYGARMSQAFSSTDPSVVLEESVIKHLPDIKVGKLEFTDGCATISKDLAEEVWKRMIEQMPHTRRRLRHHKEPAPCAFQIRIGGSKGMVRIDPKLQGRVLSLRPSMTKFQAPGEFSLEIARAFIGYSPCYLNRPLIMLLWTGGVDDSVFEKLMENSLKSTIEGMKTCAGVADQFMWNRLGASFHLDHTFRKLARLGVELDQPGVRTSGVNKILNGALYHLKLALKHKARIKVPDSYTLVGVCDEHKYLKPRQIYVCVRDFSHRTGVVNLRFLEGRVLVTRSPVIHPGDAQILFAIGKPPPDSPFYGEGNNLPNCVVFSSCGPRPVPNMLGGGDLDGDLYNIIQYREIIPPHIYAPAEYPPARLKKIDRDRRVRDSTIEDVADFMVDYVCNDSLGMIATNHLVIASSAELRARDENCMVNAELHSRAVDFVKTGFWVNNLEIRKPRYDVAVDPETGMGLKPDWQAGHGRDHTDGRFYECDSVLGRLFRAVELPFDNPARHSDITEQEATGIKKCIAGYVARYSAEIQGSMTKFDTWINALILRYTAELNHICASHTISSESSERVSEVEVMIGTNLEVNSKSDLIERMKRLTGSLADFVRFELKGGDEESPYEWLARAWKAYILTSRLGDTVFGALSFSWLALESVLDALQALDENFLSNAGIAVEPYSSIPSSGEIPEGPSSEAELQDFTWEKAEVEVEDSEGAATAQAENNRTWGQNSTNYRGGRGRGYGNGNGNGDWQGSNGYSNGGGYRGRGGSRGFSSNNTSRSSSGAGNGPGNYRSNSNRGRGQVRGRTPGWTVVAPANPN